MPPPFSTGSARILGKVARDVYRVLYQRWNVAGFDNIANSEQQHFTAIGNLLTQAMGVGAVKSLVEATKKIVAAG